MTIRVSTTGGVDIEFPAGTDAATIQSVMSRAGGGRQGPAPTPKYDGWGEWANDMGRTALQGVTLGFGDEITAGVRSVLPTAVGGASYGDALKQEREGVRRFREHNPATAFGAELVAGVAVPAVGAARALAAAPTLAHRMSTGAKIGAGYGMVGGFGAGEDGAGNRLKKAGEGAMFGAGIGAALPAVIAAATPAVNGASNTVQRAVQTLRGDEESARAYLADRLRAAGTTEVNVAADLQRGQAARHFNGQSVAELPETIADVHPALQRVLRGIKVGGSADDIIEPALATRQAGTLDLTRQGEAGGQFERVSDQLRRSMNVGQTALRDDLERSAERMRASARENFSTAYANGEAFDLVPVLQRYAFEAQNLTHPAQRAKLVEAINLFDPHGYTGHHMIEAVNRRMQSVDARIARAQAAGRDVTEMMARREEAAEVMTTRRENIYRSTSHQKRVAYGADTVERFQRAKEALDDMLGSQAVREQGNLMRLLTRLKHETMDAVAGGNRAEPTRNRAYFEALRDYATRAELHEAADFGRAIARGTERVTTASWNNLSTPQQRIARKAYYEEARRKLGEKAQGQTTDFTGELRKPNTQDELRIMLPPRAGVSTEFPGGNRERLAELVEREQRMSDTARKVLGGSPTADKLVDAIDVSRLGRVARYLRENGGVAQAAITGLSEALERMTAMTGRRARYLAEQLLTGDPAAQMQFLERVHQTYGARRASRIRDALGQVVGDVERSLIVTAGRYRAEADDGRGR